MTNIADLLQKPTDLNLHCLLRQGMSCSAREGLILNLFYFQLLMKSPQKRLVDLYALQNTLFFKTCNFTDVIEKKVR